MPASHNERSGPLLETGSRSDGEKLSLTVHRLGDSYVRHFQARVLQDALTEAYAVYWSRRAEALERALPRREDFHGSATREDLLERYEALQREILACRRHANLLASRTITPAGAAEDVANVLRSTRVEHADPGCGRW